MVITCSRYRKRNPPSPSFDVSADIISGENVSGCGIGYRFLPLPKMSAWVPVR